MTGIRMKFKDFEFPSNPKTIKAEISSKVKYSCVINSRCVTEKTADKPTVVSGSGIFYEDNAAEFCTRLSGKMKDKESGWLFCPGIYPIKAYLSDFSYRLDSESPGVCYSFSFTEDCSDTLYEKEFLYTDAVENENAFDIADRCGVLVDDIMLLNDIETPFDITAGRRIRIRENTDD